MNDELDAAALAELRRLERLRHRTDADEMDFHDSVVNALQALLAAAEKRNALLVEVEGLRLQAEADDCAWADAEARAAMAEVVAEAARTAIGIADSLSGMASPERWRQVRGPLVSALQAYDAAHAARKPEPTGASAIEGGAVLDRT